MLKFRRHIVVQLLLVVALLSVPVLLQAQAADQAITGIVTDHSGALIPGAKVTVTNEGTGVSITLTTNDKGFYSAEGLNLGLYTVEVSKQGFRTSITTGIKLNPGERNGHNVALQVGVASASVTVKADQLQVNTETSENGGTIDQKQISNLMLNGRNFQSLAVGIPGVANMNYADQMYGGGASGSGTTLIINGLGIEGTTYTIDGIYDVNTGNLGNVNILPVPEGIQEFSVIKDNYSAKYGLTGGGIVNVVTKSGSSQFHGGLWEYWRNNALDAISYFATSTPVLHQNIYGYDLGGPVIIPKLYNGAKGPHKTFFFAANQWYQTVNGEVTQGSVFPQAMRDGNFTNSPTLPTDANGKPIPLTLGPHSTALLASEGRTNCLTGPYTINPACLDPVAVALLNTDVPLPNNPAGGFLNYQNLSPERFDQLDYQFRVDTYVNKDNVLTGRIMYEPVKDGFGHDLWGGLPYSTVTDSFYTTGFNGLVRLQSTITPHIVNTAGIGETFNRMVVGNQSPDALLPNGVSITQAFPNAPTLNRIPNISIGGGWSGNGTGNEPFSASDGEGMLYDDVSWVKGTQVIQAGVLYIAGIKRQSSINANPVGTFTFAGVHTGDPAADYMLGLDSNYTQSSADRYGNYHYRQGEAYIQDDWRVKPRLTLNLGVRWVYFSPDTISGDTLTAFRSSQYNPSEAPTLDFSGNFTVNSANQPLTANGQVANMLNGVVFAGKNGEPSGFYHATKADFGPRVGFNYDLFGNGKTDIHGGYGIGYFRVGFASIYPAVEYNIPYVQNANIYNSSLDNGTAGGVPGAPTTEYFSNTPSSFVPAQVQSYSLTVQHMVTSNIITSVAYAGSRTLHIENVIDQNAPLPVNAPTQSGCLAPGQAPSAQYDFDPCINTLTTSPDYTRPYRGYNYIINPTYDEAMANYNALESSLEYRHAGADITLAYTYSKALSDYGATGGGNPYSIGLGAQNSRDIKADYGPPDYDFTNDFSATWVYPIPFFADGNRAEKLALAHWSIAGLFLHQSGFANSPALYTSTAGWASRPDFAKPVHKVGKLSEWFNTDAFQAPPYGFYGNSSVGSIRGPGYNSANIAMYKTFPIHDKLATQIRGEAFNVFNHPNFNGVDYGLGDGSYGQVTSTGDPRILEVAAKITF